MTERFDTFVQFLRDFVKLAQEDPLVRYGAFAGVAVVWLAIALANIWLLLCLPVVVWTVRALRRHRARSDSGLDDLDDLF